MRSTIVLQLKKGDFADLRELLGSAWLFFCVHYGMRLALNAPLGMAPDAWINLVSYLFAARAGLVNARVTLSATLRWLLGVMNQVPGARLLWPSLRNVWETLKGKAGPVFSSKEAYLDSLLQMLRDALQGVGNLFDAHYGLDLDELIRQGKSVVIDISNLYPAWLRLFIVDLLISQVLFGRMARGHRVDTTEVVFVIDEADALVSRQTEAAFSDLLSPLALALKTSREFGISFFIGLSAMGNASRFILSNVQYHLIMGLNDEESVHEARRTLMLPPGAEQQLPALRPGEGIFREAQGPWPHPFWVKVDYVPPCR